MKRENKKKRALDLMLHAKLEDYILYLQQLALAGN